MSSNPEFLRLRLLATVEPIERAPAIIDVADGSIYTIKVFLCACCRWQQALRKRSHS